MKAEVFYNDEKLGIIEGGTVNSLIEENFDIFKKIILKVAGNVGGYTLDKAWISRKDNETCEFHAIACGSDSVIDYDPRENESKEVIFKITGIPESMLEDNYEFEIEKKEFNPFDKQWLGDKSNVVGILEGCIDYLARSSGKEDKPSIIVQMHYPTLKNNNLPVYISQLMMQFGFAAVKKTSKNKDIFDLIEECNDVLVKLMDEDKKKINGSELLLYHKTMWYLDRRGKITALKYYREKSGRTQQEVADIIGISLRQYQRYEAIDSSLGDTKRAIIEKIAETVGVKADDLVDYYGSVLLK